MFQMVAESPGVSFETPLVRLLRMRVEGGLERHAASVPALSRHDHLA